MSILIRGMEMPTMPENLTQGEAVPYIDVRIFADGSAVTSKGERPYYTEYPAVLVPPHGDLIGREWLIDIALHLMHTAKNDDIANGVKWLLQYIIEAPTIIPADKDGADRPADTTIEGMIERWEQEKAANVYDHCERHEGCTVEIWSNSETGKTSIGWWKP